MPILDDAATQWSTVLWGCLGDCKNPRHLFRSAFRNGTVSCSRPFTLQEPWGGEGGEESDILMGIDWCSAGHIYAASCAFDEFHYNAPPTYSWRKEAQRKDVKSIGDVLIGSAEAANKLGMSRTKLNHFMVQSRLIVQYRVHESDFFAERKYGVLRLLSYRKLVLRKRRLARYLYVSWIIAQ